MHVSALPQSCASTKEIEPSKRAASQNFLLYLICHSHLPPIPDSFEYHTPSSASLYYLMQLQRLRSIVICAIEGTTIYSLEK